MQYEKNSELFSTLVTLLKSQSKHFVSKIIEQVINILVVCCTYMNVAGICI